jgi:hypothetical protein
MSGAARAAPAFPADGASVAEAMVVTGLPESMLRTLAAGGLGFDRPGERLSLGPLLGIATVAALGLRGLMGPQQAVGLGLEAMRGAEPGGGRVLLVTWRGDQPTITWAAAADPLRPVRPDDAAPGSPLRQPFITIPADAMAADLARGVAALRQGSERPH